MTTILTTADLDDPELTERQKRLIVELAIAADAVLTREGWELESRGIELLWESVILRHTETGERTWLSVKAEPAPVAEPEVGAEVWVEGSGQWRRGTVTRRWPGGICASWRSRPGNRFDVTASNGQYRLVVEAVTR